APASRLLEQQVVEPSQEAATSIPQLTPIDDVVSIDVRRQYEESPYPRWVRSVPPATPAGIDAYLRAQFPSAPLRELRKERELDILVAGCGTGQHPILVAQQFVGARVLAVDLSRASLVYPQ